MYFAFKTVQDDHHHGSTKLHMDLTDAANMMLWSKIGPDGTAGCALWHIFAAADAFLLRKFISEYCGFNGLGDPVHSQIIYLTPELLELLFKIYGVRPYTIYQYPGKVVFIPAYCAHQVCLYIYVINFCDLTLEMQVANLADGIKMAVDFVSMPNLNRTHRLVSEFRMQRLADGAGDDVLQFYTMLWYAWVSLSSRYKFLSPGGPLDTDMDCGDLSTPILIELPAMIAVDALPVATAIPSLADNTPSSSVSSASATLPVDDPLGKMSRQKERQQERNRNRRHRKHRTNLTAARPTPPGYDLECLSPTCERRLNQLGLLDHM